MLTEIIVLAAAALITFAAAVWALRAYRDAGGRRVRGSLAFCLGVGLFTMAVYLTIGRPDLPDAPFAQRLAALKQRDPTTFTQDEALAVLAQAAREHPQDPLPHFYSGQILLDQRRAQEAARAYDAALRREPMLAEALIGLGRALVALGEGRITPEALAAFQQAGEISDDPTPWIYQAMAAMEAEKTAEARRLWREAHARMRADDPRREMALRMSRELGR